MLMGESGALSETGTYRIGLFRADAPPRRQHWPRRRCVSIDSLMPPTLSLAPAKLCPVSVCAHAIYFYRGKTSRNEGRWLRAIRTSPCRDACRNCAE